jgi:hypothetical protein
MFNESRQFRSNPTAQFLKREGLLKRSGKNRGLEATAARLAVGREVAEGCERERVWERAGAGAACRRGLA